MAMGRRKNHPQQPLFVSAADLPRSASHPFYDKLNEALAGWKFDQFVEEKCAGFYADKMGRPSLEPGKYFRLLLVGYFEGIDSERGIAWRCSDSLSLRAFVGYAINEAACDHSTLSRTRRLIDVETHKDIFAWVLKMLADYGLVSGRTLGVDATTLEANAAMRSIVRNDTQQNYQAFLTGLAQSSGIETPTREDLAKIDRKRKNKASNDDWHNPYDPDAKIAKMKDGSTHLAHKAEHAVDMETGAILAVTLQGADLGDTTTVMETINAASENLRLIEDDGRLAGAIDENWAGEVVADKGYHSNDTMASFDEMGLRSYVAEPDRKRRVWADKPPAFQAAVYANRRRVKGDRGKRLMRKRGELIERSFAHCYETGAMRRTHLKRHDNITKRLLIHVGAFNLGLVMRQLTGVGKPRRLQGLVLPVLAAIGGLWMLLKTQARKIGASAARIDLPARFELAA